MFLDSDYQMVMVILVGGFLFLFVWCYEIYSKKKFSYAIKIKCKVITALIDSRLFYLNIFEHNLVTH
jgi:hypothetical protein